MVSSFVLATFLGSLLSLFFDCTSDSDGGSVGDGARLPPPPLFLEPSVVVSSSDLGPLGVCSSLSFDCIRDSDGGSVGDGARFPPPPPFFLEPSVVASSSVLGPLGVCSSLSSWNLPWWFHLLFWALWESAPR